MSEPITFPPIIDPASQSSLLIAPASIKEVVLAQFKSEEANLRALAAKYVNVVYDVSTTKGLDEAKAARNDLRQNGRFMIERAEKRVKSEVNDLKRIMADEVDRLVAITKPVEDAIDAQIKVREEQIAAAKAEKERKAAEAARIEAERKQRHEDGIAMIASYVQKASGKSAEKIAEGIAAICNMTFDPVVWEEYAEKAAETLNDTLQKLELMRASAAQAERDAAELAALRAERDAAQAEALKAAKARADEAEKIEAERNEAFIAEQTKLRAEAMAAIAEAERIAEVKRAEDLEAHRLELARVQKEESAKKKLRDAAPLLLAALKAALADSEGWEQDAEKAIAAAE